MNLTLSAVLVTLAFVVSSPKTRRNDFFRFDFFQFYFQVVAYADPIPRAVAEAKPDPDPEADPNAFLRRRVVNGNVFEIYQKDSKK